MHHHPLLQSTVPKVLNIGSIINSAGLLETEKLSLPVNAISGCTDCTNELSLQKCRLKSA